MHSFINSGKDSTAEALLQRSLSPGTVQLLFRNDSARSNPGTVCVCVCARVSVCVCSRSKFSVSITGLYLTSSFYADQLGAPPEQLPVRPARQPQTIFTLFFYL